MRQALRSPALLSRADARETSCGIVPSFPGVSPTSRQVNHVLLTRSPLYSGLLPFSHDLHVLGTPPAFTLSQDQTLQKKSDTRLSARPEGLARISVSLKAGSPAALRPGLVPPDGPLKGIT